MRRGLILFSMICLGAGAGGCFQAPRLPEVDGLAADAQAIVPPRAELHANHLPPPPPSFAPEPVTVLNPERTPYYLSLAEAMALALENGTIGLQTVRAPGLAEEDLNALIGLNSLGADSIRVLSYQPARAGTAVESALSRFDAQWNTSMNWFTVDEPTTGLNDFQNGAGATFLSSLAKPLPTGGVAGISFRTDYQLFANPPSGEFGVLNPTYFTRLTFGFEQPLLRGFGVDINQLSSSFPSSTLFSGLNGRPSSFAPEGILIARLRFNQQRADLERVINFLLLNVEAAYWNLYSSYVDLFTSEQGLRQAHFAWMIGKNRVEGGKLDSGHLAQIQGQYEQFRGDRTRALGRVLEAERNLRVLIGLPVEDGKRLVPLDAPRQVPVRPEWKSAVDDALANRPELKLAREELIAREANLRVQKNNLLPDLRFFATYTPVGLGSRLDGNGGFVSGSGLILPDNALHSLSSDHYNDWTLGLTLSVPLGFRYEHARERDAKLAIAQQVATLQNQEQKALAYLTKEYSKIVEATKVMEIRRLQRKSEAEQVEVRFRKFVAGVKDSPIEFLLDAQRQWTAALSQEYQAIVDYNIALASFEFAKGTLMQYHNVSINEGPLPEGACGRAVDHLRRQGHLRVLRHPAVPLDLEPPVEAAPVVPASLTGVGLSAPSIVGLEKGGMKGPDATWPALEQMPAPALPLPVVSAPALVPPPAPRTKSPPPPPVTLQAAPPPEPAVRFAWPQLD